MEPFVSVLIVALYNTLSLCKLLYVSQCFSRPFCFKHSRTKKVPFLETPQSLRAVQYHAVLARFTNTWYWPVEILYTSVFFTLLLLFFLNNIYLVTTLLITIFTFTWRENKNNVQERKEKYNVTAFTTN